MGPDSNPAVQPNVTGTDVPEAVDPATEVEVEVEEEVVTEEAPAAEPEEEEEA